MKWDKILIVGLGGSLGAMLRYMISDATAKYLGNFPLGTLIVNVLGGFLIGFIMEISEGSWPVPAHVRIFLTTGIMGGLTTFSTFSYETVSMLSDGKYLLGGANAGLNLCLALAACWAGKAVARML
ncbi:fluoride efflux transporter CrcB [Caproiciproducens faecalis]|uniref:Fluoride-specific ion channel FluC n=1 Tax=Caproiciproducens faecalis TaxID=2820301 RepID=A0ABS7DLN4_9FIRM|nr:fluoride efflux transporter CrcB [Caproiciproducens faecalis]MBW7571471.1 fluoride efflux transporter CrcB [Caproiciproducens faecalis]